MNGSRAFLQDLVENLNRSRLDSNVDIFISPPSVYIEHVRRNLRKDVAVGAQNCFRKASGAYTGEISAEMLKDIGTEYMILGHTERRTLFKETDNDIGLKVAHALQAGLTVIACIGETLDERESNTTMEVLFRQLQAIAHHVQDWTRLVIAYEPIWAIGTGRVATPAQAQEVHAAIRRQLEGTVGEAVAESTRIIYGGSVNLGNAADLAKERDVDGLFVGGASLKPEFVDISKALKVGKVDNAGKMAVKSLQPRWSPPDSRIAWYRSSAESGLTTEITVASKLIKNGKEKHALHWKPGRCDIWIIELYSGKNNWISSSPVEPSPMAKSLKAWSICTGFGSSPAILNWRTYCSQAASASRLGTWAFLKSWARARDKFPGTDVFDWDVAREHQVPIDECLLYSARSECTMEDPSKGGFGVVDEVMAEGLKMAKHAESRHIVKFYGRFITPAPKAKTCLLFELCTKTVGEDDQYVHRQEEGITFQQPVKEHHNPFKEEGVNGCGKVISNIDRLRGKRLYAILIARRVQFYKGHNKDGKDYANIDTKARKKAFRDNRPNTNRQRSGKVPTHNVTKDADLLKVYINEEKDHAYIVRWNIGQEGFGRVDEVVDEGEQCFTLETLIDDEIWALETVTNSSYLCPISSGTFKTPAPESKTVTRQGPIVAYSWLRPTQPHRSVLDLIRERHLRESEVRLLGRQLADDLHALRELNIVHSDLLFENLLLTTDMHIEIGDFGFATDLSHGTIN
ncbi:triosephosphate isomerase [Mortierella sp. 14UC]|nr:triosephosphate isomerase [Mortierella sp. 14UC]